MESLQGYVSSLVRYIDTSEFGDVRYLVSRGG